VVPWPGSVLAARSATWIVAAEIVETTRTWARGCAEVDPLWIEAIAGDLVKKEYSAPYWDEASQNTVCSMKLVLWGLVLFQGRRALAREHDPDAATLAFCREALVEGRLRGRFSFLEWNRELRERIEGLEERMRRRALAVGSDSEVAWYASRLPAGISGLGDLQGFLKREGEASFRMTESDLMTDDSQVPSDGDFPLRWKAGALDLPLSYRFAPEDDEDGITITIPEGRLDAVPDAALEWLVPGHLAEKVESMLRGLSRENRQRLSPLPESARRFVRDSAADTGRIALREALSTWMRTKGLNLPRLGVSVGSRPGSPSSFSGSHRRCQRKRTRPRAFYRGSTAGVGGTDGQASPRGRRIRFGCAIARQPPRLAPRSGGRPQRRDSHQRHARDVVPGAFRTRADGGTATLPHPRRSRPGPSQSGGKALGMERGWRRPSVGLAPPRSPDPF
jgi:hypothetical protein